MANSTLTNLFTDIADAIREKSDTSESIPALEFPDRIRTMSTSEDLDAEMETQDDLISQIFEAIEIKSEAIGNGSGGSGSGGSGGGGGAELNIAYGDTAPDDTTKLWVKAAEPSRVEIANSVAAGHSMTANVSTTGNSYQYRPAVYDGSVIYLFGGRDSNGNVTDMIQMFDPATNTVETLEATLPKKEGRFAGALVGDKIYLFSWSDIYCFDTVSRTITTMSAKMPVTIEGNIAATVGTKIYTLGGGASSSITSDAICVYDTETGTVTRMSVKLPTAVASAPAVAVGTKVYQFGGSYYSSGWKKVNTIVVYDTMANTVETLSATLPQQVSGMAAAAFGTKVYLFGGYTTSNTNTIMVFDTVSHTLETLDAVLPVADNGQSAVLVGGDIYLFSGAAKPDAIHKFSVASVLPNGQMVIVPSVTENVFDLISNESALVKMGALAVYAGNANNVAELVPASIYKDGAWTAI